MSAWLTPRAGMTPASSHEQRIRHRADHGRHLVYRRGGVCADGGAMVELVYPVLAVLVLIALVVYLP